LFLDAAQQLDFQRSHLFYISEVVGLVSINIFAGYSLLVMPKISARPAASDALADHNL
jgi:hypothetical protein